MSNKILVKAHRAIKTEISGQDQEVRHQLKLQIGFLLLNPIYSAEIEQTIIDLKMLENHNKIQGLDGSLDFQKEFTYINMIQDELSRDRKQSRLQIHSKLSAPLQQKNRTSNKKISRLGCASRSEIRKKSKTMEKSLDRKKISAKKSIQKNYQSSNKKCNKTVEAKTRQINIKSTKSLKAGNIKKQVKEEQSKRNDQDGRKFVLKDKILPRPQKTIKSQRNKSKCKAKINKTKSQAQLQYIPLSQIRRQPKLGLKQSKIIHQYFGMEGKLSLIAEQKNKRHKRNQSKLSKCKTQSSSSLSLKNGLKYLSKGLKQKK